MNQLLFKYIPFYFLVLLPSTFLILNAQNTTIQLFQPLDSILNITESTYIFVDKSASLDLDAIINKKNQTAFSSLNDLVLEGKYTRSKYHYWLYFSISNASEDSISSMVFKCGLHEQIDLYQLSKHSITHKSAGFGRPIDQKNRIFPNKYSIKLSIPPHSTSEFYVRISNELHFSKPYAILKDEVFEFKEDSRTLFPYYIFHVFFFTFLFFTAVFTLTQYILNKEKAFLYYALSIIVTFLLYCKVFDLSNPIIQILPLEFSSYFYYTVFNFPPPILGILFIINFFNTPKKYPRVNAFIKNLLTLVVIYFFIDKIILYFDKDLAWMLCDMIRISFFIVILYPIYVFIKSKNRLAIYIIGGLLVTVIFTIINLGLRIFQPIDNFGYWDIAFIIQYIGVMLGYIFFWLGLGYLSQQTQIEKNTIQQNLEIEKQEKDFERKTNQLRNKFFTNITHEFRTPLTIINGLSSELKENHEEDVQQKSTFIHRNGIKMLRLVNQLLSLSKLDDGKMDIHYQKADIITFFQYLVNSFESLADSKGISLAFTSNTKELFIDYDPQKIQSILSNLLSNAIKFTPKNGKVEVNILHLNKEKEQLEITIKDNGIGIKKSSLPYIFDRFHQEEGEHKNIGEGSGIGLSLVKELVELLDAEISVKSEAQKGTTFSLLFPITRSAPLVKKQKHQLEIKDKAYTHSSKSNKQQASIVNNKKPFILVIEDNIDVRFFITSCLQDHYQVMEADNGQKGINMAIEQSPDLIISDVMMPLKDGFEVCKELKNHEKTDHIPIILLTAKATQKDKNEGLFQGADAYLIKPFDKQEFLIRIKKLLESRQKLQSRFRQLAGNQLETADTSPEISDFLNKINTILEVHFTNSSFSAPTLCRELGYSKSRLYEQLKKEVELSPGLYIRAFRLRKAKKFLLANKQLTIREIAYEMGFNSPVYFSQEFKKAFDCSPGEFRKNQNNLS